MILTVCMGLKGLQIEVEVREMEVELATACCDGNTSRVRSMLRCRGSIEVELFERFEPGTHFQSSSC